jgi:hypothetical protein
MQNDINVGVNGAGDSRVTLLSMSANHCLRKGNERNFSAFLRLCDKRDFK